MTFRRSGINENGRSTNSRLSNQNIGIRRLKQSALSVATLRRNEWAITAQAAYSHRRSAGVRSDLLSFDSSVCFLHYCLCQALAYLRSIRKTMANQVTIPSLLNDGISPERLVSSQRLPASMASLLPGLPCRTAGQGCTLQHMFQQLFDETPVGQPRCSGYSPTSRVTGTQPITQAPAHYPV